HTRFDCDRSSDVCSSDLYGASTSPAPRIERVAQPVAEQVERQDEREDRQPRPERHPRRLRQEIFRGVQHAAPARRRRLLAEPERSEERRVGKEGGAEWWA